MASRGWLLIGALVASLAAAGEAPAAAPCEEGREQTGLALGPAAGALAVALLDPDTPAAASGLRTGDVVVQVNGVLLRTCGEWARAVTEARREQKALLLLVRRGDGETPAVLAASTWARTVVVAAPPPPPPPAEPPTVKELVATPPPAPLPPAATVSVDEVTAALAALAPADAPPDREPAYRTALARVRRQVDGLAAAGTAPPEVVAGLRTVLRYYQAAGVAWASAEAEVTRAARPRHIPPSEDATAPFFADSEAAAAVDQFPFLRETVVRDPRPGPWSFESAGLWQPLRARTLLWEHGREELARLTGWLATGPR